MEVPPFEKETIINKSITISVRAERLNLKDEHPLFAINWLNTRYGWLYNLYGLLAATRVFALGAKIFIKARVQEFIEGDRSQERSTLMIVNYPSVGTFLTLVSQKYFQVISLIRNRAVKDFNFGFVRRLDGPELLRYKMPRFEKGTFYLLHHFKSKGEIRSFVKELEKQIPSTVQLHFAGEKTGRLVLTVNNKRKMMPFMMDGLVIWESGSRDQILEFFRSPRYKEMRQSLDSSYAALLDRIN